ncbi:MAG: DUF4339 domain-containing protein [Myxococcales bacterium]
MSAMYYLSRGGAPEGPFEEARLVYMIQSGELTQGGVCAVGQQAWSPLHAVPAFAQALAARGAPQVYGPPPVQPAQPAPQAYGSPQPPAQPQYGAPAQPQPQYGAPAQSPQAAAGAPAKKSNRALLFVALGGVFFVLLAGAAGAAYLMFFSSGGARSIAKSMPRDSEFFVEVPSVHELVSDLREVQYLDTSLRDDKQVFDGTADSIATAFDISSAEALALLASSETFGIAGRKLATDPEVVIALGMKNASPVEALLKSPRFSALGTVGTTGKRYQLTQKQLAPGASQDIVRKGLFEAQIAAVGKGALVWFPKAKVLTIGDDLLVRDLAQVIEASSPSVEDNPAFQAASKDFDGNARLTLFVDPALFTSITDPKVRDVIDNYFKPAGPITGSLQVKPAGFVTRFTGHVQGAKLPSSTAYEGPQALDLGARLPEETFCYMGFSTRTKLSGADAQKLLLDQVGSIEPRSQAQVEQGLHQLETLLGVTASKLFDGVGGQSVIGLSATPGVALEALGAGAQAAANFNLTWVLELKDGAEYKKLAAQLKQKLLPTFREVTVTDDGAGGFSVARRLLPVPVSLRVKFLDKYLFVTAGSNALAARTEAAFFKGERTLKDDAGHKASLAALPDTQHFLIWVDTGRLGDTLQKSPLVKAQLTQSGVSLDKIKMTGPERIVSALSVRSEVQNEIWTYQLDALNFQALAPLGAAGALFGGLHGLPGL